MNAVKKNQIWIYESINLQRVVAKLKLTPKTKKLVSV